MWIFNNEQSKIINTDVVHTLCIDERYDTQNGVVVKTEYGLYADDELIETFEDKKEAQKRLNYFVCVLNSKEVKNDGKIQ